MWRPHPRRADVNIDRPSAWSTDDRSGMIINHNKLAFQWDWAGSQLINKRILVGPDNMDKPQEQLRTIILPPDPDPLFNARPENYVIDETDWRVTQDDEIRVTQDDELRVTQPSQYEATDESID